MKKVTIDKIENELHLRLSKLGKVSYTELKALDGYPIIEATQIDGKSFEFTSWSERAVDQAEGVIAVFVGTWKQNIISANHYMKGFLTSENGYIRELNENELWEYD